MPRLPAASQRGPSSRKRSVACECTGNARVTVAKKCVKKKLDDGWGRLPQMIPNGPICLRVPLQNGRPPPQGTQPLSVARLQGLRNC